MVMIFLFVSVPGAAREKSLITVDNRLLYQYGDNNRLFNQTHWSGMKDSLNLSHTADKPGVSTGKFFGQVLLGIVGNVAGGYAGAFIGYELDKGDEDFFDGFGGAILGYFGGSTFGSALGVYLVGNSKNIKGSFGSALLGSLLGEGLAIGLSLLAESEDVTVLAFITLPPICSALLFNSSLKYRSSPISNALINFNSDGLKIGIPFVHVHYVQVRPLHSFLSYSKKIKQTLRVNINLMNIAL